MARLKKWNEAHELAVAARARVAGVIDSVDPVELVQSIKRAPSLRGMILGYIAEEMFEKHVLGGDSRFSEVIKHDDHDRTQNKSDRTFCFRERTYTVQLKSIQTNSIAWSNERGRLEADVQNDASDRRKVTLPNGRSVETTNYVIGDFDILAVPLFPFTGTWEYAYKRNRDCRVSTSSKYEAQDRQFLLSTTETITWPLDPDWVTDLTVLLDDTLGEPLKPGDTVVIDPDTPLADTIDHRDASKACRT
jgi:hypothetical protein